VIEAGQAEGTLAGGVDERTEAVALIALADGLALQGISDPQGLPPRRQEAALDAALERLRA
jgi:hypothetical protein